MKFFNVIRDNQINNEESQWEQYHRNKRVPGVKLGEYQDFDIYNQNDAGVYYDAEYP